MKNTIRKCLIIVLALNVSAPVFSAERVIFNNVSVITMIRDDEVDGVVVTENGIISMVLAAEDFVSRNGDRIIDGKGGFLIPGLIDAHVHIDHEQDLKMMALFGVTSAINMRGLPWHLRIRDEIRTGSVFAPDFITSGDYLDGNPPDMLPMASVDGIKAAGSAVKYIQGAGFDFIKVYSELSRDQYLAVCDTARELNIGVIGHIVEAATLQDLIDCPQLNIAHGEQLFKVLESQEDSEEIRHVLEAISDKKITLTPNRELYNEMARQPTELEQLLARPESALIHPATYQPWRAGINRYARRDEAWAGRVQKVYKDLGPVIAIAGQVDAYMLVAGTDMPVAGSYPGASMIDEIEAIKEAGLNGFASLATATRNAGMLLNRLQPDFPEVGVIRTGARADLVLVSANPVEQPETLRTPQGVMLRGHWYDKAALQLYREELSTENSRVAPKVAALESAVFGRNLDKAMELFTEYRKQDPDTVLFAQYPFFFFGFSLLYGDNGLTKDPEQARKAVLLYDMYRQTYPELHSAHHVYGLALEAAGDYAGAIASQRVAMSIWPKFPPAKAALKRLGAN